MSPPIDERSVFQTFLICPQSEDSSLLLPFIISLKILSFLSSPSTSRMWTFAKGSQPVGHWSIEGKPNYHFPSLTPSHCTELHYCTALHCIGALNTALLFCTLHSCSAHYILDPHTTFLFCTLHSWSAHYIALHYYTASPYWTASLPCFIALHHSAHGIVQLHCIKCSDTVSCCIFVLLWTALHNCSTLLHCTA